MPVSSAIKRQGLDWSPSDDPLLFSFVSQQGGWESGRLLINEISLTLNYSFHMLASFLNLLWFWATQGKNEKLLSSKMRPGIAKLMTFLLDAHTRVLRSNTMHFLHMCSVLSVWSPISPCFFDPPLVRAFYLGHFNFWSTVSHQSRE